MKPLTDYMVGDHCIHKTFGRGKILEISGHNGELRWRVDFPGDDIRNLAIVEEHLTPDVSTGGDGAMDANALKQAIREVLREENVTGNVVIGDKWFGGKIVLHPGNSDLKPKEIPINEFFHKIVMVRDKLRVLEQRINNHALLEDAEKVNLQQYITRIYGSLTTFNILFDDRADGFVGTKG